MQRRGQSFQALGQRAAGWWKAVRQGMLPSPLSRRLKPVGVGRLARVFPLAETALLDAG